MSISNQSSLDMSEQVSATITTNCNTTVIITTKPTICNVNTIKNVKENKDCNGPCNDIHIKEDISYDSSTSKKQMELVGYVLAVDKNNNEIHFPLLYIIHENKFFFKYNENIIYELTPKYNKLENPKTFMTSIKKVIKDEQLIFKINLLNNKFNRIKQSNESVVDFDIKKNHIIIKQYILDKGIMPRKHANYGSNLYCCSHACYFNCCW